jgi:hypothetical protein
MSFIPLCENLSAGKDNQSDNQQQYIENDSYKDRKTYLRKNFVPLRMVDDDADDVDKHCTYEAAQRYQQLPFHLPA